MATTTAGFRDAGVKPLHLVPHRLDHHRGLVPPLNLRQHLRLDLLGWRDAEEVGVPGLVKCLPIW